jgi:flavodoxin
LKVLIVFDSESGNTKKVVEILKEELYKKEYSVTVKHALTCTSTDVEGADLLIIGTPVHGYILFGQGPTKTVKTFIKNNIPENLKHKPVIGFATYLFFPAGALKPIRKKIESNNGKLLSLVAKRRTNKAELVSQIMKAINNQLPSHM